MAALRTATPYQSQSFCRAWLSLAGPLEPLIVIARDSKGMATALLPLYVRAFGPWRFAAFQGARMANYQMGLFSEPGAWSAADAEALIKETLRSARLDAFMFSNQPASWRGAANPFAALGGAPSPSFAYATRLDGDFEIWQRAHFSTQARKKRRAKTRKLEALGPIRHRRAVDAEARRAVLAAFFAQKAARMRSRSLPNEFDEPAQVGLLEILAADVDSGFELHMLEVGERIVAVFGGLLAEGRLSGVVFSHDIADDVAPMSPGELLISEIVRDCFSRNLAAFDLGVGEARYKSECCEITEPLIDAAFGRTFIGRLAGGLFLAARAAKREVKHSPGLFDLARVVQRGFVKLRFR